MRYKYYFSTKNKKDRDFHQEVLANGSVLPNPFVATNSIVALNKIHEYAVSRGWTSEFRKIDQYTIECDGAGYSSRWRIEMVTD